MFWMLPLALAAAGALADKKNPIRGAAIGAGVGMTGGLLAPAAAGAAGATAAGTTAATGAGSAGLLGDATAAGYGGLTAVDAATMGGGATAAGSGAASTASTGGLLGTFSQYAKPASQAMSLAQQGGLMGGQQQQPQASPFIQPQGTGAQVLAQLAQQGDASQTLVQEDAMRRKRRMGLLGMDGGMS